MHITIVVYLCIHSEYTYAHHLHVSIQNINKGVCIGGGTCYQVGGGYYEVIAYSYCKIMQDNSGHTL